MDVANATRTNGKAYDASLNSIVIRRLCHRRGLRARKQVDFATICIGPDVHPGKVCRRMKAKESGDVVRMHGLLSFSAC
ncbi:hypothetical protein PISMIDRAFT_678373 [Pisolithus microcarpus 441]|uniref:Uncharacterized protein n=1 Tax=Pisolithus microcarpus 441 TaxID=765257 RepID=A0A0C9ZPX2_9AGAM|nr:hypothetical protein PISMIDRAFT_678373 [Pisolithus microcarpus 441]